MNVILVLGAREKTLRSTRQFRLRFSQLGLEETLKQTLETSTADTGSDGKADRLENRLQEQVRAVLRDRRAGPNDDLATDDDCHHLTTAFVDVGSFA